MKRTELKRTGGLRRTRLKARSTKRRQQDREVNDLAEFSSLFIWKDSPELWIRMQCLPVWCADTGEFVSPRYVPGGYRACWYCGIRPATQVNHIASRNAKYRHHRCNASATCDECHREVIPGMSAEAQFHLKRDRDPDGYSHEIAKILVRSKNGRVFR